MEYSVENLREKIEEISKGCRFRLVFSDGGKDGRVYVNGNMLQFWPVDPEAEVLVMDSDCWQRIGYAFHREFLLERREAEDTIACKVMLRDDPWSTRFWRKNGKFNIESDNQIYAKAESASELLGMIARLMPTVVK